MTPKEESEIAVREHSIAEPRRPYSAPRLRKLGSVRELTLGQSVLASSEGGGTYRRVIKM